MNATADKVDAEPTPESIRLEWREINDGAAHTAISQADEHNCWRIDYAADGEFDVNATAKNLRGETDPQPPFETLAAAMTFCQERETALLAGISQQDTSGKPQAIRITKGISLWQPWASLIAWGEKKIETRSWPTSYRGPIAILATAMIHPDGVFAAGSESISAVMKSHGAELDQLPLGSVVAVADLVDCFQFIDDFHPESHEGHFGDFTAGRFGFRLENIRPVVPPIPCSGAQRIFDLDTHAATKLAVQMGTAPSFQEIAEQVRKIEGKIEEEPKKPFDVVEGVEKYIAKAIDDAENEEETITAKVLRQRNSVARLSIAMLRMDQGKKTIKERYEEAVELLDSMEKDAANEAKVASEKLIQPDLPFGEKTASTNGDSAKNIPENIPDPRLCIRLDTLEIKPALLKKLAEHQPPILTVGDVADWCNLRSTEHGGNNELTDVKGIGEAAATAIEKALDSVYFDVVNPFC